MGDFSFLLVIQGEPSLEGVPAGLKHGDEPMELVTVKDCGDLMKAAGAIPAGSRWITVHPNGNDAKGVPVLVQEVKHGSGVWHVIGGAGGKLNYLKMRGVRSEGEYKQEAAEKQKTRREAAKAQRQHDKETGLDKAKQTARDDINTQRKQAEHEFIQSVGKVMGWEPQDMAFNEDAHGTLSEQAKIKAREKHHRELLKRSSEAVDLQRRRLVEDQEARADAEIGELPLESAKDDQLSVADLMPVSVPDGAGIAANFKKRAEANGLTDDELKSELNVMREEKAQGMDETRRRAAIKRGETAQMVREQLEGLREDTSNLKLKLADAKQAVELLKSEKKLKSMQRAARAAAKEVDTSDVEPKAYVLQAATATDDDVAGEVEDQIRTLKTQAFLSEVGKTDPTGAAIAKHVSTGAYNSINALSMAVGGASMLDRSVVDVLGIAGASQVLARKLRLSLGTDADRLAEGLEEFHTQHYMRLSQDAIREAHDLQETAKEFELGEAENADDLVAAAALNRQKQEALVSAGRVLGHALGEMEANAALVMAMKEKARDTLQVSLGKTRPEDAIRQVRALGLQKGDYKLDQAGANTFLTLNAAGMDRLVSDTDPENAERIRRNLDIMQGKEDEDDWLPRGFARRPDLAMPELKPGVAPQLAKPMDFASGDRETALKDYIGGRMADGDRPADILSDIQSADFFTKSGDTESYRQALDAVAPNKDGEKTLQRVERLDGVFQGYADDYVSRNYGAGVSSLNRQNFAVDDVAQDAVYRALSDEPSGVAAYKPIGELTYQDQKALRDFFHANVARESEEAASLREDYDRLGAQEPEKTVSDMFNEEAENPEWRAWQATRSELADKMNAAGLTWPKYAAMMRGHENAYAAMQDLIRSRVAESFAGHYNRLNPGKPLKLGRSLVRGNLNHLDAVDPAAREKRLADERALVDSMRERNAGRYASGRVADKLDAARDAKEAAEQSQMGFFAGGDLFGDEAPADKPLGVDERHTLGHAAERTVANVVQTIGKQFKPGQPVKLFRPTMSGKDGAARQRAIKLVRANKRMILGLGVGSGKTAIGLGGFTDLHAAGQVKKGVFIVPSIVQGNFGTEALRFLEPGKFNWHCEPDGSRDGRMKAYKDSDTHFVVATHQSFRDDLLHMASAQDGTSTDAVSQKLESMSKPERAAYIKSVLDKEGIGFDYVMADEAHGLLNRTGKENSRMANAIEGVTDNAGYYVHASGDPVKNDASEAFDLLSKMDGQRYSDKDAFMRRYGGDSQASRDGLRRELARHLYADSITPDIQVDSKEIPVPVTDAQKAALADMSKLFSKAKIAKMEGRTDVESLKALMPKAFEGASEDQHEAIAKGIADSLGIVKATAIRHILDNHPEGGKIGLVSKTAAERKGKPGVVFAHSLEAVESLRQRLESEGHRVITITGKDSPKEKDEKIRAFRPQRGESGVDIVIASDAGATGANLQTGQWLVQYDTPMTAMVHAQRRGRINRIGQENDIELIDLVTDHPEEAKARKRLREKYQLRDLVTSPLDGLDETGIAGFLRQVGVNRQADALF